MGAVGQHQAGGNRLAVEQDSASAAVPFITTFLGSGEAQFIPKSIQQRVVWFDKKLSVFTINGELQRLFHPGYTS
jgi:hypothetical protein